MGLKNRLVTLSVIFLAAMPLGLQAATDEIEKEEIANNKASDAPGWADAVKAKYNLTDEQMTTLSTSGVSKSQMAVVADLAQKSGKSIDDILKMRVEQKMGWGKIAKDLGLPPGSIGHSISSLRHDVKEVRQEAKEQRKEDRKEERAERKEDRAEKRAERKDNRGKKP